MAMKPVILQEKQKLHFLFCVTLFTQGGGNQSFFIEASASNARY
jgi:hypothetical protein